MSLHIRDACAVPPRLVPGVRGCDATDVVGSWPLQKHTPAIWRCILLQVGAGMILSPRLASMLESSILATIA